MPKTNAQRRKDKAKAIGRRKAAAISAAKQPPQPPPLLACSISNPHLLQAAQVTRTNIAKQPMDNFETHIDRACQQRSSRSEPQYDYNRAYNLFQADSSTSNLAAVSAVHETPPSIGTGTLSAVEWAKEQPTRPLGANYGLDQCLPVTPNHAYHPTYTNSDNPVYQINTTAATSSAHTQGQVVQVMHATHIQSYEENWKQIQDIQRKIWDIQMQL